MLDTNTALDAVEQIYIAPGALTISLSPSQLRRVIETSATYKPNNLTITLPFTERWRGNEMKIVVGGEVAAFDPVLPTNVALANQWYRQLKNGQSFEAIAEQAGVSKRRVQQIVDLAFLAPDVVRDITNGSQPLGLVPTPRPSLLFI